METEYQQMAQRLREWEHAYIMHGKGTDTTLTTLLKSCLFDLIARCNFDRADTELSEAEDILEAAIFRLEYLEAEHARLRNLLCTMLTMAR